MKLRTLIVEDEAIIALSLEAMLNDLGHRVVGTASRLEEAREMITSLDFEIAVLDLNLGGEMSFPLADLLIQSGKPFVFSTGYGEEELDGRYSGRPVLTKPYDEFALVAALGRL
jgi:CheY-like chemotaxis protein